MVEPVGEKSIPAPELSSSTVEISVKRFTLNFAGGEIDTTRGGVISSV